MSSVSENADVSLSTAPYSGNRIRLITGALTSAVVFLTLFAFWPYQHGHYDERISVLKGLYLLVTGPVGSEWIFCLVVPFITAFLIYLRRESFRGVPIEGSAWGIVFLLFSLVLYWLGYRADTRYLGYASAQLVVGSLIVWLLGWQYMRLLFFPWLFFAFTWPFLPLEEMLAFKLRIFAAHSSSMFLNILGVDCIREGTAVISGADPELGYRRGALFQLDVDDPCSGIRSLFSLIMISVFYGYIALTKVWQRVLLFAAAVPLAVAGNIVRMLLLAYGCIFFGTEFAVGTEYPSTYHEMSGIAVFVVALAGMFSIARVLESKNLFRKKKKKKKKPAGAAAIDAAPHGIPYWRSASALGLVILVVAACYLTPAASGLSAPGLRASLPQSFSTFWGRPIEPSKAEIEQLIDVGVEMSRMHYANTNGRSATATIVVGGSEGRTLHRPEVCLPGQGWKITGSTSTNVDLGEGSNVKATLLTLVRSEPRDDGRVVQRKGFNLYWYVGRDRTAATYNKHIMASLFDGMFRNIYHRWSMISVFGFLPFQETEDFLAEEEVIDVLKEIAREVVPHIKDGPWVPGEGESESAQANAPGLPAGTNSP